jgi:hypothetical protein
VWLLKDFLQEPHGDTSKKTMFFIVTAVKTSNLTMLLYYLAVVDMIISCGQVHRFDVVSGQYSAS